MIRMSCVPVDLKIGGKGAGMSHIITVFLFSCGVQVPCLNKHQVFVSSVCSRGEFDDAIASSLVASNT